MKFSGCIFRGVRFFFILFLLSSAVIPSPLPAQTITKGPYLLMPTQTAVTIRFELDTLLNGQVLYGTGQRLGSRQTAQLRGEKKGFYLYQAELSHLKPGSRYFYRVRVKDCQSDIATFKTAPTADQPVRFVVMGDSRSHPDVFRKILRQVELMKPDFIISMGDLVEDGGDFRQWTDYYFAPAAQVINHIPLISTLGDHEGDGDRGELFRHFLLTTEDVDSQWFAFRYGNTHFVSLDYRHPSDKKMIGWYRQEMTPDKARWKFVFMHRPCFNLGGHRSYWGQPRWPKLFRVTRVDMVFAGHSHQYERFFPMRPAGQPDSRPVTYVTTGGAGAGLYEINPHPDVEKSAVVHHFIYIRVHRDTLQYTVYDTSGSEIDHLKILKKQGRYAADYLKTVQAQEKVDLMAMFARAISNSLGQVPQSARPAFYELQLRPVAGENVSFEISLTEESGTAYRMEPFHGTLSGKQELRKLLPIFSKNKVQVGKWGDMKPELRLRAKFKSSFGEKELTGGAIEYWPEEENQ